LKAAAIALNEIPKQHDDFLPLRPIICRYSRTAFENWPEAVATPAQRTRDTPPRRAPFRHPSRFVLHADFHCMAQDAELPRATDCVAAVRGLHDQRGCRSLSALGWTDLAAQTRAKQVVGSVSGRRTECRGATFAQPWIDDLSRAERSGWTAPVDARTRIYFQ